jgi:hypothetical protein
VPRECGCVAYFCEDMAGLGKIFFGATSRSAFIWFVALTAVSLCQIGPSEPNCQTSNAQTTTLKGRNVVV